MEIVENELAGGSFGDADRCSWDWVQVAMGFVPEICFDWCVLLLHAWLELYIRWKHPPHQGCISCGMCSYPELTKDHVLTSAYVNIFRTVTRNAVNKSAWRKWDCSWLPLNKHAMNIGLRSLRIRVHLSWRTEKHIHVLMHQCILWYKRNRNIFVTFQSKSLHLAA